MESLVLIVSILFLFNLSIGFIAYGLSFLKFIPNFIIWILGLISIVVGFWWITLPIGVNLLGLLPLFLGISSIKKRMK